jgi:hypothetical protein
MVEPSAPREPAALPSLDDDERAFREALGRTVEWHRPAQLRALWHAFWPGALVLLPLGSVTVALPLISRRIPLHLAPFVTLLGVLVTASGPLWAIVHLLREIRRDLYVAIRVDGLCVRLDPGAGEQVYDWNSIVETAYDPAAQVIRITREGDAPLAIGGAFNGIALPELCQRIRDARRLAVWNRLRPRFECAGAGD